MVGADNRQDFPAQVKETLAQRVGSRCSNPNCRQLTSGPRSDSDKSVNVGVAAHITAASPGGPRYDGRLTSEERTSIENGIWLCQTCAKMVDNDPARYTVDLLRQWKRLSEEAARLEVEGGRPAKAADTASDEDLVRFFAQCFDRPAFQDRFEQEMSVEAFDRAIEDTITAVNTGTLRSRDGAVLSQAKGKAFLQNPEWRRRMDVVVDLLRAIRSRYDSAVRLDEIRTHEMHNGRSWYHIRDDELCAWMDATRSQAMAELAAVCREAEVQPPVFPRGGHYW